MSRRPSPGNVRRAAGRLVLLAALIGHLTAVAATDPDAIRSTFPYTFNEVADRIVIINCTTFSGDRCSGSGFIANMDGKTYLITNQHVILGSPEIEFKTASGETLHPRGVELSATRDIARLLLDDHDGFKVSATPALGMPVAIFGNSEGGGVATELYGEVTGVTADLVEVSADFVSGNSGSPVLNMDREVIGIASYVTFVSTDESDSDADGKEEVRRFCYRLTNVGWTPVNWKKYNEDYGRTYLETEAVVNSIFEVVMGWGDDPYGYVSNDYRDYDLKKWAKDHNSMVDKIVRLSDKGSATQKELDNINKQIRNGIGDSAEALAEFCGRKSRQMELKLSKRDLTGFLEEEFASYVDALAWASSAIEEFGEELSGLNYFHFE